MGHGTPGRSRKGCCSIVLIMAMCVSFVLIGSTMAKAPASKPIPTTGKPPAAPSAHKTGAAPPHRPSASSGQKPASPPAPPVITTTTTTTTIVESNIIPYESPNLERTRHQHFFYENFDNEDAFKARWTKSQATKAESEEAFYDGEWALVPCHSQVKGDGSLLLKSKAKHHAISSKLNQPLTPNRESEIILQYEIQFRNGQECGGGYIKLLAHPSGPSAKVNDKTQYSIMFGPDKCGNDHKLHFIFQHKNPKNHTLREIHWKKAAVVSKLDEVMKDGRWHIFRLHLKPDNSYEIQMDRKVVGKGSLLEDFNPPVNPPKEIDDHRDFKPEDWDERERIPDPDAKKPMDWDENEPRKIKDPHAYKPLDWNENEPEVIPDPEAEKPQDWDEYIDGEWQPPLINNPACASLSGCGKWQAPLIDNPKFKGKWKPPMMSNPNYRGRWAPRKILNPDFFEDLNPYNMLSIDAVAFEIWSISDGIAFDNILLTSESLVADYVLDKSYQIKKDLADDELDNWFVKGIKWTNRKPWLWAIYVLLISIPVIIFIACCCIDSRKEKETDDDLIERKKKDVPSQDSPAAATTTTSGPNPNRPTAQIPIRRSSAKIIELPDEPQEPIAKREVTRSPELKRDTPARSSTPARSTPGRVSSSSPPGSDHEMDQEEELIQTGFDEDRNMSPLDENNYHSEDNEYVEGDVTEEDEEAVLEPELEEEEAEDEEVTKEETVVSSSREGSSPIVSSSREGSSETGSRLRRLRGRKEY